MMPTTPELTVPPLTTNFFDRVRSPSPVDMNLEHELYEMVPVPPLPTEVYQNEEDLEEINIETELASLIERLIGLTPSVSPAPMENGFGDGSDYDDDDQQDGDEELEDDEPSFDPVPEPMPEPPKQWEAVLRLLETAKRNDFFGLFGLKRTATLDQVSTKRRQLNKELHPDQFSERTEKEAASGKLALVNQIYTNVFAREKSLKIYKQICLFREEYPNLLQKGDEQLQTAIYNLIHYQREMTKAYMPQQLMQELDEVLKLLQDFRPTLSFDDWKPLTNS
jgi:hypothetical protein